AAPRTAAAEARATAAPGAGSQVGAASAVSAGQVKALYAGVPFEELALDGMRRTIARRLAEAKQSIPHFYLNADIALDRLLGIRSELNTQAEGAFKLSINDFIIKAVALALQRVPEANAVWAEESILRFKQSDVAVAVAVPGGLYTPVIRQAEGKSIGAVSTEMKGLAERAQARSLKPDEYQGGSISISNLGMYGVRSFSAIVNPPQAAILAVGAAERRALEGADGSVRFGSVMSVTLSCDHRVIDGALGGRLLAAVKTLLEAPLLLLV
ncbi:MAG: 2-oxo acid dehydrogenase subunit E2, partial [Steroidobacteraceae bacterium]